MRLVNTINWYEVGDVSQGQATELARLSRSDFNNALSRFKVTPFQYATAELAHELANKN